MSILLRRPDCGATRTMGRLRSGFFVLLGTALLGVAAHAAELDATPVPDTIKQRLTACTACHGEQGRATSDGYYPRIAGKPAGYLYNQLHNFREGRRQYPMMTYLVD
ncbi:MAG: c-type cytochrome, partial [Collimonas sp.]|uniref:c-type cytochrome n=1 Tax=Collimonas sp. TaxID=1963772 RepID=UPI003265871A